MNNDIIPSKGAFWEHRRLLILITLTITVALILVSVSMALYSASGAAQLDLSRPGYRSVSDQAIVDDKSFGEYAPLGTINEDSLDEFEKLYESQSAKAKAVDAFSGDPLNPEVLLSGSTATE
ncbi:MAG: hypothetical protein JWN33_83 [Candidatus Saccharibacteria bacterium]|nr:hypothetical protein [Candidatus Saccharibacteria bacterium]